MAAEKELTPREFFNRAASQYAQSSSLSLRKQRAKMTARLSEGRVLDVGVGTGHMTALYSPGKNVTGLDFSEEMIRIAKGVIPQVPCVVADLNQPLPFPDGSFDTVVASEVIYYLEDRGKFFHELRRVLSPRGRIILFFGNSYLNIFYKLFAWLGLRPHDPFGERTKSTSEILQTIREAYKDNKFGVKFWGLGIPLLHLIFGGYFWAAIMPVSLIFVEFQDG